MRIAGSRERINNFVFAAMQNNCEGAATSNCPQSTNVRQYNVGFIFEKNDIDIAGSFTLINDENRYIIFVSYYFIMRVEAYAITTQEVTQQ